MTRALTSPLGLAVFVACCAVAPARAELTRAEPLEPIHAEPPSEASALEVVVTLHVVIDAAGVVESAASVERAPADAPEAFVAAALAAARRTRFRPSLRDGAPVRSRVACRVVFPAAAPQGSLALQVTHAQPAAALVAAPPAIEVRGTLPGTLRGLGDFRIEREWLTASPRQQTSELLSAAPGFFVDHEDGEGLGNDVYLRGFDLEHGSGIEMRLGHLPINAPMHVRGQGYADVDFIIPEVVSSIHVLQGPYDPRQGDAAIVGSATFALGVAERGYQLKTSYGSFDQLRVLGVAAPRDASEATFAAVAVRKSDGFGTNRDSRSGSLNAQLELELGRARTLRVFATAYAARTSFAGVTREDDVAAGRIGFDDTYPFLGRNQGVKAERLMLGAELEARSGQSRLAIAPFALLTHFRARENFTGSLESSQLDPSQFGRGDLNETRNREGAVGLHAAYRAEPLRLWSWLRARLEPGLFLRAGQSRHARELLDPERLDIWDRRRDLAIESLDAGAYADLELALGKTLRVAGGPRADLLLLDVDDRLPRRNGQARGEHSAAGVAVSPRITVDYALFPELSLVAAYGEGFRSLDPERLSEGSTRTFSKVRSVEAGVRAENARRRFRSSLAVFQTWVENELVFVAEEGGLETQNRSVRRGVTGAVLARPVDYLLASTALSVVDARFRTRIPGVSHHVPNVPPLLFHTDLALSGPLWTLDGRPVGGRLGLGYTFAAGPYLTDQRRTRDSHALNIGGRLRYGIIEVALDLYNVLGQRYADSTDQYVSNWGFTPGQLPASVGVHTRAAPPRTALASLALSL